MQAILETVFDTLYLFIVLALGIAMLRQSKGRRQYLLFGVMAIVLGAGDAFHLIPRAVALNTEGLGSYVRALGAGKQITSITMTVFYVLLYHVWQARYHQKKTAPLTAAVYGLAAARVILSLMPQNKWLSPTPPLAWGIYRNIPFALMGLLTVALFYQSAKQQQDKPFAWLWLTIVISFACYLPVVLFADTHPLVGMLMIPKTCAYVWTVFIGYQALKGETV